MGFKKWLMKQQWRMVQIRGIWGLFYGILLLAAAYFGYIPFFAGMGAAGPFTMAFAILAVFLLGGYVYDRVFMMWAPAIEVATERNPYQYVPSPYDRVFWLAIYSTLLDTCEEVADKFGLDSGVIRDTRSYYASLQDLKPDRRHDIDKAVELSESFIRSHPFHAILENAQSEIDTGND